MTITRHERLDPRQLAAVRELAAAAERRFGAPQLNDEALLRLAEPGFVHLLQASPAAADTLLGYAQLDGSSAEIALLEAGDGRLVRAAQELLAAPAVIWTHGERSPLAPELQRSGFHRARVLRQLRMPLGEPAPMEPVPLPPDVAIGTFAPGADEDRLVQVNAAAFAHHPEQGSWTRADVLAREAEPWFDPAGLFLANRGAELLGFHWTKVHPGGIGEVYVLGVAPEAQGLRLGSALLAVGLGYLRERGCRTAMLYVDDTNTAAMALYVRYGFHTFDVDVQWQGG